MNTMTLTLGSILHSAGIDPADAQAIRHAYVREHEDTGSTKGGETVERRFEPAYWSLVPSYSKTLKLNFSTHNAKTEGIMAKSTWKKPVELHRAIVFANGYYEWQGPKGHKTPYFIHHRKHQSRRSRLRRERCQAGRSGSARGRPRRNLLAARAHDRLNEVRASAVASGW
jgi:hypothetical protein